MSDFYLLKEAIQEPAARQAQKTDALQTDLEAEARRLKYFPRSTFYNASVYVGTETWTNDGTLSINVPEDGFVSLYADVYIYTPNLFVGQVAVVDIVEGWNPTNSVLIQSLPSTGWTRYTSNTGPDGSATFPVGALATFPVERGNHHYALSYRTIDADFPCQFAFRYLHAMVT